MRARLALTTALALAAGTAPALAATSHPAASHDATRAHAAHPRPRPAPAAWKPRPAKYGVAKQRGVEITMDDGTKLEADVLRPAAADGQPARGRFPVILTQTPYNKEVPELGMEDDYMVERGYIQVLVDVRGTGSSEGEWTSFGPREQKDYCETAAWAVKVPGSDGRLALDGASYGAIDQIYTAACHPKGLKAMFPVVPMGDAYRDVTESGGQADTAFIPSWLGLVTGAGLLPASVVTDPAEAGQALADHAAGATKFQAPALASAATGQPVDGDDGAYDGSFYKQRSPLNIIDKVNVPTFVVGGEYDLFQRSEPLIYEALHARGVPSKLLIGPWTHTAAGSGLPADGVPSLPELELRWFDHYVRGVKDPTMNRDIAPVTVYRLGTNRYERSTTYPLRGTRYVSLRLPAGEQNVPYVPVAGVCSESTAQWTAGAVPTGQQLCTGDHAINDKLGATYDFPVKRRALRFDGPAMARLFVSTTRSDAFVTARLEAVAPDGTSTPLTNGWQLLSLRKLDRKRSVYRNGLMVQPWHPDTRGSVQTVTPGKVYQLDVEIFPTAARIPAGDSLRLAVQTSDEPHATPSAPTAVDEAGGTLTIHSSKRYPSALILGREGR